MRLPALPEDLKAAFLRYLAGETRLAAFEDWVYANHEELERSLKPGEWLELLELDYQAPDTAYQLEKLLGKLLEPGEVETYRMIAQLRQAIADLDEKPAAIWYAYEQYRRCYTFFRRPALRYVLCYVDGPGDGHHPIADMKFELSRVLGWLERGEIRLTGPYSYPKPLYQDLRSESDKRLDDDLDP